ncbi:MAG: formylglycine-generating enzyme family protein [Polyangiaceae bacterium]|jgi:formylglycine-generating enzyme required for sulfatase activity
MKRFIIPSPVVLRALFGLAVASGLSILTSCSHPGTAPKPWVNRFGMAFVGIVPGTLVMGSDSSPDESPAHSVTFRTQYWIQTTELTQDQWKAVMGTSPWTGRPNFREAGNFPAVFVKWPDAQVFMERLNALDPGHGYRLPSESEWERVCTADGPGPYTFGREPAALGDYGWIDENAARVGERYAHAVGQKKANRLGLFDIHGNVWEWCEDNYRDGYKDAPNDGRARVLKDVYSHVYRGGGWSSPARSAACTARAGLDEDDRSEAIGLRVVASRR